MSDHKQKHKGELENNLSTWKIEDTGGFKEFCKVFQSHIDNYLLMFKDNTWHEETAPLNKMIIIILNRYSVVLTSIVILCCFDFHLDTLMFWLPACTCGGHANVCHLHTGKCFCTTKGIKGDQCQLWVQTTVSVAFMDFVPKTNFYPYFWMLALCQLGLQYCKLFSFTYYQFFWKT